MKLFAFFTLLLAMLLAGCSQGNAQEAPPAPAAAVQAGMPATTLTQSVDTAAPPSAPVESPAPGAQLTPPGTAPLPTQAGPGASPSKTVSPPPASSPTPLAPGAWKQMPVIPASISPEMVKVFLHGLELGNNPRAFSKVGDCGSTPAWFLGDFDRGPRFYNLGDHADLEAVIQEFQGSYSRTSLAARAGFNTSAVFTPLWADRKSCTSGETPLACEYRIQRPAFSFITLGTNDIWHPDAFEPQMRKIIEFSLENGVIPILSTKADQAGKDDQINEKLAQLAAEYRLPLWNFWLAAQALPDGGLQEDGSHLTWGPNRFNDPQVMQKAWPVRNLTALQVLDAVWRGVRK